MLQRHTPIVPDRPQRATARQSVHTCSRTSTAIPYVRTMPTPIDEDRRWCNDPLRPRSILDSD